ncbi:MAG: tRNA preQ1(34) S-adenosylmethionine ribosyltransferase-isomerase QueA [Candidatus Gracilibacteria bacterium]|jgi:S-adenosylmethionine:tRNA ribosyltransferase-isomerase
MVKKKSNLKADHFDYMLPKEFIAQNPASPRDSCKLLIYDSKKDKVYHEKFYNIGKYLNKGDCLVVNSSKVIPARILFDNNKKEIFLLKKLTEDSFNAMIRPGKAFKLHSKVQIIKNFYAEVVKVLNDGTRNLRFFYEGVGDSEIQEYLSKIGQLPLPPYITDCKNPNLYQTIYAKEAGSVASPTAGLHFTKRLISKLKNSGVGFEEIFLHVGLGTFLPVKTEFISDHKMHSEEFVFPKDTANKLNRIKSKKNRIIAVGTTSVRVLETCFDNKKGFIPKSGETDIFIYPNMYKWKVVDGLITNFHLPKSTLLMLVSSFLEHKGVKDPIKKLLDLYEIAKKNKYRFYSFGDSMFII